MLHRCALLVLLLMLPGSSASALESVEEIRKCVLRNFPERSMRQTVRFAFFDRAGAESELVGTLSWKRFPEGQSKLHMRVQAPPDLRGAAFLIIGKQPRNDMFMYLPELDKVRRISSRTVSGSLFGTDFSYEDLERLQEIARDASTERVPDSEADVPGRSVYAVAARPHAGAESAYSKVVSYIDRETCVTLKIDFFGQDGELRKVLVADAETLTREGEVWLATRFEMKDLRDETRTHLHIQAVEIDVDIPDRQFSQAQLARGR